MKPAYALVGDIVGANPTHLVGLDADGRIVAVRATCGGRRRPSVADPTREIRDGRAMGADLVTCIGLIARNCFGDGKRAHPSPYCDGCIAEFKRYS